MGNSYFYRTVLPIPIWSFYPLKDSNSSDCQFRMKSAIIGSLIGLSTAEPLLIRSNRDTVPDDPTRRYFQLTRMMEFFNDEFDERKYWTYGCNCLILGDRPMSDPGHGPPIDALDTVCKKYKDCLKCARMKHGDTCIGEFVKYSFSIKSFKKGNGMCQDDADSCGRHLCECDAMFAQEHVSKKDVFDEDYHLFWSKRPNGWEPKDNCPKGGNGPYIPECCVTPTGPAFLYNSVSHQCLDGTVSKKP